MNPLRRSEVYGDNYHETEEIFTEAEYLAIAKKSRKKLEFIEGKIYVKSGGEGSFTHGMIVRNLDRRIWQHLKDSPCSVYPEFFEVECETDSFVPDIVVNCEEQQSSDSLGNTVLIVEVLSPVTREMDLFEKFHEYQKIDTLQEYVVIEQDSMCLIIYRR